MKNILVTPLRCLRGLLLLGAAIAGSAQAAVYVGNWDPQFDASSNLGWRAVAPTSGARFFVDDTCVPSGPGNVTVINTPTCDGKVLSAVVELFDFSAGANSDALATLIFTPTSFTVSNLYFVNGELKQLDSSYSDTQSVGNIPSIGVGAADSFFLQFTSDGPRLAWIDCTCVGEVISYEASTNGYGYGGECMTLWNSQEGAFRPVFTVERVPEPGTLALACLGLFAFLPRRVRAALSACR